MRQIYFAYGSITVYGAPFQESSAIYVLFHTWQYQVAKALLLLHLYNNGLPFKVPRRKKSKTPLSPIPTLYKFRLFRFRSPLLTES